MTAWSALKKRPISRTGVAAPPHPGPLPLGGGEGVGSGITFIAQHGRRLRTTPRADNLRCRATNPRSNLPSLSRDLTVAATPNGAGLSPTANRVAARACCFVRVPMASRLLARHVGRAGTYVESRQEWAKGNRSSCRHHYRAVQLITQRRTLHRPRRRPAGRCTARVSALRPIAPRFPAFLSHQGAQLCGFSGFSTRAVSLER